MRDEEDRRDPSVGVIGDDDIVRVIGKQFGVGHGLGAALRECRHVGRAAPACCYAPGVTAASPELQVRDPRLVRRARPEPGVPDDVRSVRRPRVGGDGPADADRPRLGGLGRVPGRLPDDRGTRRCHPRRRPPRLARPRLQPAGAEPMARRAGRRRGAWRGAAARRRRARTPAGHRAVHCSGGRGDRVRAARRRRRHERPAGAGAGAHGIARRPAGEGAAARRRRVRPARPAGGLDARAHGRRGDVLPADRAALRRLPGEDLSAATRRRPGPGSMCRPGDTPAEPRPSRRLPSRRRRAGSGAGSSTGCATDGAGSSWPLPSARTIAPRSRPRSAISPRRVSSSATGPRSSAPACRSRTPSRRGRLEAMAAVPPPVPRRPPRPTRSPSRRFPATTRRCSSSTCAGSAIAGRRPPRGRR